MERTLEQYDAVIDECVGLFIKKAHDYGTAWRILRVSSLTRIVLGAAGRLLANGGPGGYNDGGGGGGSGGVVYLYAPTITVPSGAQVTATGGVGGDGDDGGDGGNGGPTCGRGGNGGLGRIRIAVTASTFTTGGTFNPPLPGLVPGGARGQAFVTVWPN